MSKEEIIKIEKENTELNILQDTIITGWYFPKFPFVCNINISPNVKLFCKSLIEENNINGTINIYSSNNSELNLSLILKLYGNNELEIANYIEENQNVSQINIKVLQMDSKKSTIKTVGVIKKNTKDNDFTEKVKVLNIKEEKIKCMPELIVLSNEATANHSVTMKTFTDEELFYLESKGLNKLLAKKIIVEGFLNN